MSNKPIIVVIGGGAAGFFGAITCAENNPHCQVILLEKVRQLLAKVRISGGGRCNVTHSCFEPAQLINSYPRGGKELRGPFSRFQPRDTIAWFEARGVKLKVENDGRMFPITDSSETIISCLLGQAKTFGVEIRTEIGVIDCMRDHNKFTLTLSNGDHLSCDRLLVATGGTSKTSVWLEKLGHTIMAPVPSLFTFNIPNSPLNALSGISVPHAKVILTESGLHQSGPLLITHWGFSGPAILKLSAWGARLLHEKKYKTQVKINWLPDHNEEKLKELLLSFQKTHAARLVSNESPVILPKNLWKALLEMATVPADLRWAMFSKLHLRNLMQMLQHCEFQIDGKSTNKDEFVTCGGIKLSEVNFKTMESLICPGLYFAGEVLDIDGVTGGFNFQNAWTTGWLAGHAIGQINELSG